MAPALACAGVFHEAVRVPRRASARSSKSKTCRAAACAVNSPSDRPAARGDGEVAGSGAQSSEGGKAVDEECGLAVGGAGEFVQRPLDRRSGWKGGRPRMVSACWKRAGGGGRPRGRVRGPCRRIARTLPGEEECNFIGHPGLKKNLSFCQRSAILCRPILCQSPSPAAKPRSPPPSVSRSRARAKFLFSHSSRRHILQSKSAKRKRQLAKRGVVHKTDMKRIKDCLPFA